MKINYEEIDENIREVIKILNNKGYSTIACCEGHWNEDYNRYLGGYILFDVTKVPKNYPNLAPIHYKFDLQDRKPHMYMKPRRKYSFYWMGSSFKKMSREEKDAEKKEMLYKLKIWAESLERRQHD